MTEDCCKKCCCCCCILCCPFFFKDQRELAPLLWNVNEFMDSPRAARSVELHQLQLHRPFEYLPDDYAKPKFENSRKQEANEIVARIEQIFLQEVVTPRRDIDGKLKSFKTKAGMSQNAPLPLCFEEWKSKASVSDNPHTEILFKVTLNDNGMVKRVSPNEPERLTPELTEEMTDLLDACNKFLNKKINIYWQLKEEGERFAKFKNYNMKTKETNEEIESLLPELDRLAEQVKSLLVNIKLAASSKPKSPYGSLE